MAKKVDKLLAQAQKAYQKKDKQKGRRLIDQILKQDYLHEETWRFLHQLSAPNQPFEQFQRKYTETNYPDMLPLLQSMRGSASSSGTASMPPQIAAPAPKKPSFFARLFGRRSSKGERSVQPPPEAPASALSARPVSQEPVDRISGPESPAFRPQTSAPVQREAAPAGKLERDDLSPVHPPLRPATSPVSKEAKIRILVVDDIAQTRANVIRALRFQESFEVVGSANNGQQGMQLAMELQPDVIIMDVNMPGMDGIAATSLIKRQLPTTEIIIMTVQDDVDYMRGAMAAGARDFLAKPPMVDEMITAVKRAGGMALESKAALRTVVEQAAAATPLVNGKVITVYSPRGGAGSTTLAVNLAAIMHREETPVVVVDGNLQFGDVPVFFNTQSRYSILDLGPHAEELDPQIITEVLAQHSSGIRLLSPPPRPEQAEAINSWQFNQVIKYLRGLYPYVIIDATHHLTDITLAALDVCDLAIVLATQDIPALARLRQFLELAPALELDSSNILLVVNAYSKSIGITSEQIEQVLKQKLAAVIPTDKAAAIPAMNRGAPFMLQQEFLSRPIAQSIQELKEAILQRLDQLDKSAKEG